MKRFILVFCVLLGFVLSVAALPETDGDTIGIASPADMELLRNIPDGDFVLVNDIDMSGAEWVACAFSGSLNGNGHAILNLSPVSGNETSVTVDGNKKKYDTVCVGLFSALNGARIENLTLADLGCDCETDKSCYFGSIAGFADESVIENCVVNGNASIRSGGGIAGAGGLIGFGAAEITDCFVDMELSLIDTNEEIAQEQYLGGVMASGYANIRGCKVCLSAETGVFGYAHNGGVMGMLSIHKKDGFRRWTIENCTVEASFRFFEKPFRSGRRAYCKEILGEQVHKSVSIKNNRIVAFSKEEFSDIGFLSRVS